ncbi:hypothetical protein Tco_1280110 [Tanacetum coccineum]
MAWRHHDSNVADPFPKYNDYDASEVAKLRDVVILIHKPPPSLLYVAGLSNVWKHADHSFSLKDSKGKVTHLADPAARLEDIPPKTRDMAVAEIPCRKAETIVDKDASKEGPRKKRRVRVRPQVQPNSEHVSSPTPLNHAKPLETLANEEHVSLPLSGGQGKVDVAAAMEGHGDNEGGLSGLQTQPSPAHRSGRHPNTVERPARDNIVPEVEASYSARRFGNLPFTPQWGLTDSSRMVNSRECRDMMENLFTPADDEFFNEGVRDESAIRRSWKLLCQFAQQQANTLLRFEALKEQHAELVYAHESCTDVKARYRECKKELAADRLEEVEEEKKEADNLKSSQADRIMQLEEALKQAEANAVQLRAEKVHYVVEAGKGEMVRQKIVNQYLPTFVRRLHQSAEYTRSLGEVFTLVVGTGFINGISIGHKEDDIHAILKTTPNVDPASSETFLIAYEKLFDQRYPYVDKVARMYLVDPSEL